MDPLKIKLVRERIFDFCSVDTLKNCRLVSTEWRDDSMKAWRDKAVLRCTKSYYDFTEYMIQLLESGRDDDNNPIKLRNLKKYPFKGFFFADSCSRLDPNYSGEATRLITDVTRYVKVNDITGDRKITGLKKFLSTWHSLEVLRVHGDVLRKERDFSDSDHSSDSEQEDEEEEQEQHEKEDHPCPCDFPKLKRLEFTQDWKNATEVWGNVLGWFPNLQALFLKYCYFNGLERRSTPESLALLANLKDIFNSIEADNVFNLKELEICMPAAMMMNQKYELDEDNLKKEIIHKIIRCNFPLEKLSISLELNWDDIRYLLESYKDTLRYLQMTSHFRLERYIYSDAFKIVPRSTILLSQLKEASFGNGSQRALYMLIHLELPQIEKLTIEKDASERKGAYHFSFPNGRKYEKLELLDFLDNDTMPGPKTIETLIQLMPNLTHLTIPLDKTTFQIVCKQIKGLRTLNILSVEHRYEELNDEILTGISVSKRMGEGGSTPRPPNITDLVHLTDVKICCDWQLFANDVKFTDHAVIHGFLQLPRLYSLNIAFKDLSEDVRGKLLSHVKGEVYIQEKSPDAKYPSCILTIGSDDENERK